LESVDIEKLKVEEKISGTNWSNKKVLIVDDVPESIFLLSELLKRTQIKITSASNGIEAIDKIAEDPGIDIVLMDIQLPEMSGLDAAERIKKIKPGIVIIIQTAFSQDGYEQKSKEAGCDDIVYKPINFDILIKKMNRFL
jgi:CheY-like chemotaxis protein